MRIDLNSKLFSRPIAHRGLWGGDIIENSLTAYKNAVENGYPFEIDLYSSTDGVLFSFHDKTLSRMTGENGCIYDKSAKELKELRLLCSDEQIPTFSEILSLVNGKVPLLIEIKNQPKKDIVKLVLEELKGYEGEYAIQSFNPLYINQVKNLEKGIIRGILATGCKEELSQEKGIVRFIIKRMALNFLIKPDFISYEFHGYPLKKRKTKNKATLCWTITSQKDYDGVKPYVNNVIFENFIPKK